MMTDEDSVKTTIAEDIEIVGSIKSSSSIRFDGKLSGDLTCGGNAVIGSSATVKGNLSVESVSIMGQVNGNVTASDRIELKSTARLNGDIRAKRLTVEDGVTFVGKSEVNPSGPGNRQQGTVDPKKDTPPSTKDETGVDDDNDQSAKGGFFAKKQ